MACGQQPDMFIIISGLLATYFLESLMADFADSKPSCWKHWCKCLPETDIGYVREAWSWLWETLPISSPPSPTPLPADDLQHWSSVLVLGTRAQRVMNVSLIWHTYDCSFKVSVHTCTYSCVRLTGPFTHEC